MRAKGNLFIITAPSGAGKTSLVKALLKADPHVSLSISHTTRKPRSGEAHDVDYHFVDEPHFVAMLEKGGFLESALVHGAHYGTSQEAVESALSAGSDLVLEIDWQGAEQVRKQYPDAISLFILPPSMEILAQRLHGRGQDAPEVIARRLAAAREEISHVGEFDYVIINDLFETALHDICAVIRAQRLRCLRQLATHQALLQHFN